MATLLQHSDWLRGRVPDSVRAHLRQLVEVVGYLPHVQPLGVVTADAVLLAGNRPFFELLGTPGEDALDADWDDFMPGWSDRAGREGDEVPDTLVFEDYLLPVDGDPVWVRVVALPVFCPAPDDETDEPLAAWALFLLDQGPGESDHDQRRRGAMLDLLLESPREFVVQIAPNGELRYLSPSLRRALGPFADGAEGKPLASVHGVCGEGFAAGFSGLLRELLHPPYRAEREMRMVTTGGEHVVEWRFESLLADGGVVTGILGVGHDVTERRRAEDELACSELRLRTLVEATSQITWTSGPAGVVDGPMESWSAFTGQTDEEVVGDGWADAVHPDDRAHVLAAWRDAVKTSGPYAAEYRLRAADGVYHWMEARAVPLPGSGKPRYVGVGHDITARKEAEAAARRRVELESMVASVSTRLAGADLDDVPLAVDFALGETGRRLGVDDVSLFLMGPDGVRIAGVKTWRRDTGTCEDGDVSEGVEHLSWVRERVRGGDICVLHSVDDIPPDAAAAREEFQRMRLRSLVAVPVVEESILVAVLMLEVRKEASCVDAPPPGWTDDDVSLVRLIADQLGRTLVWHADERNLRLVADGFLAFGPDVHGNLTEVCRVAAAVMVADVVLYQCRREKDVVVEAGWNLPNDLPAETRVAGSLAGAVLDRPDAQACVMRHLQDSIYAHTSSVVALTEARTYAGCAVVVEGRAVGAIGCLFGGDVVLRESQLELLRVLGRAAAVEEERRHALEDQVLGLAEMERAMERTVGALSGAMSTRDPYTAGHERRVAQLVVAMGRELGLGDADLRQLRLAATVHDLGKIAVPAEILSKPTHLSDAEAAIIQRHSEAGQELLEPAGLPRPVTDAVLQHHERLDGSGYPFGLVGDEIGLFARVIAVADVVEAMSSHRPYRPAIGVDPALREIELGRGVRYDERVADVCLRLFRDQGFTFEE